MKFAVEKAPLSQIKDDILVVGIFKDENVSAALKSLDSKFPGQLADQVKAHLVSEGFKGKVTDVVSIPTFGLHPSKRLVVVGLGSTEEFSASSTRKAAANVARKLKSNGAIGPATIYIRTDHPKQSQAAKGTKKAAAGSRAKKSPATIRGGAAASPVDHLKAAVDGWTLAAFDFDKYKSTNKGENSSDGAKSKKKNKEAGELKIAGLKISQQEFSGACQQAYTMADATNFARSLVAEPPLYMTPTRLSLEAKNIASKDSGLTCKVLGVPEIEKLGMGSFLGVARGADEPAKFIIMKYSAPKSKKTVAIVGKGITFDSGGLSLKPSDSMERMKYDMAGAAAVIASMRVIAKLKPRVSVLAVVAATENMPSGKALHPGDVLTSMNGKTIEVNNTDAEGRLVLADALTYVLREKVDEVIDLATLTGAVVTALGRVAGGIMGSDQELIDNIIESGEKNGEKLWQLPLFDEYKQSLKSDVADLKNAGSRGEAGSCCAGMFLKEFVDGVPWAHLDIAGVAWSDKIKDEVNKGGTGFGVRTLCTYLMSQ
jgi:leucyl aminopeptidase